MENTLRGAGHTMNVKKRFMVLSELFVVLKQQDAVRIQQGFCLAIQFYNHAQAMC